MKYFCTKDELHGTDCHEFFSGEWDGRFWNEDSLYIYDDILRKSGLMALLKRIIPDYSQYDSTKIYPSDWEMLCEAANASAAEVLEEAKGWIHGAFSAHGSFTILGI